MSALCCTDELTYFSTPAVWRRSDHTDFRIHSSTAAHCEIQDSRWCPCDGSVHLCVASAVHLAQGGHFVYGEFQLPPPPAAIHALLRRSRLLMRQSANLCKKKLTAFYLWCAEEGFSTARNEAKYHTKIGLKPTVLNLWSAVSF